jgi:hypothetical protein
MTRPAALVGLLLALTHCEERVCEVGTAKDCPCPHGIGQMRCNAQGTAWQGCECPPAPAAKTAARGAITEIVKAEDLGPADAKTNPDQKTIRITFRISGPLAGEPTLTLPSGSKLTARPESALDPNASEQARIFLVPNDAVRGLRLGVGPEDSGQPVGELSAVPAADRFRERQIREHR